MAHDEEAPIRWTPDCQGKWDYDGPVVRVSSRYWPRGGGFHSFSREAGWQGNEARPELRPSASSSILLFGEEVVESSTFEGETEAEVKAQVEAWVEAQVERIATAVRALYPPPPGAQP